MTFTPSDPTGHKTIVRIVDDQPSVRDAISDLLASVGIAAASYESARAFLDGDRHDCPGCLILDVRMPGLGGLDLQTELPRRGIALPIVFITGHGDIPMSVRAIKAGAVDFLTKPFDDQALIDAVNAAIAHDAAQRERRIKESDRRTKLDRLTAGERDVVALSAQGLKIRAIANQLGISEITVKVRRSRALDKTQTGSLTELIRLYDHET